MIGLGKLGKPVAVTIDHCGHDVICYDMNSKLMSKQHNALEKGFQNSDDFTILLKKSNIKFGNIKDVCDHSEIIFIAVQTPHSSEYEGITPLPQTRKDFDYSYLKQSICEISSFIKEEKCLCIISTCLPGTLEREIKPLIQNNKFISLYYVPQFIAMGTVLQDFMNPEFWLIGTDSKNSVSTDSKIDEFFCSISKTKQIWISIASAELAKVAYNTFISTKIGYVNTLMEMANKIPTANIDEVMRVIKNADKRLISTAYLSGGMGDGGGCHPRDNIAMSWLAKKLNLKYDWFESIMIAREEQAEWLIQEMMKYDLPKFILGYSFKPETNITTGSHALLVEYIIKNKYQIDIDKYDPYIDKNNMMYKNMVVKPHVILIGINHPEFIKYDFCSGSVIIDPFRYMSIQFNDIEIIALGG